MCININQVKISFTKFYPEEILTKKDAARYRTKGTCEISLCINELELDIRNITYRIEHGGKIHLKPPFRIHSNKKAGIKPKLVPSLVFRDPEIWPQIEYSVKEELARSNPQPKKVGSLTQLDFFEKAPT